MTRALLLILAVLEMAAGVFGLVILFGLFPVHGANLVLALWPLLATAVLFLAAAAAIFLRRPWSYYLHIVAILLIGAIYIVALGPAFGTEAMGTLVMQAALVVVPLTVLFLLPSVRRFFGAGATAST